MKKTLSRQSEIVDENKDYIVQFTMLARAEAEKMFASEADREKHMRVWFTFLWCQLDLADPLVAN